MTECNQSSFGFEASGRREIVARFDGGTISSDGGAFLLRQTDQRLNLLARLAGCFLDGRNQVLVEHSVLEMLSQRVFGLALGCEDINDHEQLRSDPVFGILAGRGELAEPLAGKSTLSRTELHPPHDQIHEPRRMGNYLQPQLQLTKVAERPDLWRH